MKYYGHYEDRRTRPWAIEPQDREIDTESSDDDGYFLRNPSGKYHLVVGHDDNMIVIPPNGTRSVKEG